MRRTLGAVKATGRAFGWLWAGQTASVFGTAVSTLALPTLAILGLHVSPFAVGALAAVQIAAYPLLGLLVGVWVDRLSRRATMLVADVVRALALASIPLAAVVHALTYAQLLVVAACVGVASVFFDVAYQSLLPALVPSEALESANAQLEFSNSAAQIAGNGIAGGLIALLGAPLTVAVDAASYLVSVATLAVMRVRESHRDTTVAALPFGTALREGVSVVLRSPVLLPLAASVACSNFSFAMMGAVYLLFVYRVLHLSPALVGVLFAVANIGFAGALVAPRIAKRLGTARTLTISMLVAASGTVLVPLAAIAAPLPLLFGEQLISTLAVPIFNITQLSMRQRLVPPELLGRMNATMKTIVWGTMPLGSLAGGALGGTIGIVPTLALGAVFAFLAVPWLFAPGLRALDRERYSSVMSSALNG